MANGVQHYLPTARAQPASVGRLVSGCRAHTSATARLAPVAAVAIAVHPLSTHSAPAAHHPGRPQPERSSTVCSQRSTKTAVRPCPLRFDDGPRPSSVYQAQPAPRGDRCSIVRPASCPTAWARSRKTTPNPTLVVAAAAALRKPG